MTMEPIGPVEPKCNQLKRRRSSGWLAAALVFFVGLPVAFAFGFDPQAGLEALRRYHVDLLAFIIVEPLAAPVIFMIVYAVAVAASIPGVALLTVVSGFLFGWLEGTIYALVAGTVAGAAMFLVVRHALAGQVRTWLGPSVRRFARLFRRNAPSYVFLLHLVPVLPFGMIIALPAACGVRPLTFIVSAFLGLLPGTALLAYLGVGLGDALYRGPTLDLASFLTPEIMLALAGLAVLSLLPVVWRSRAWRLSF